MASYPPPKSPIRRSLFSLFPGAMAAAAAAAKAPAAVVLLGEDDIALGRMVKIAGLQRLHGEGGQTRVGGGGHR